MSHSVEKHLVVAPAEYDAQIRRFVPGYETMFEETLGALREHLPVGPTRIIDLGAGTGALAERILEQLPDATVMLLDADAEMLSQASARLERFRDRIDLMHGSFANALPHVHAAVASLSLHHLHDRGDKIAVYHRIYDALEPRGILVNADATISETFAPLLRERWAAHLVANGDSEARAYERFAQWAIEDHYYGIDEELEMLREAGFLELDVRWRVGPTSVLVARKPD